MLKHASESVLEVALLVDVVGGGLRHAVTSDHLS